MAETSPCPSLQQGSPATPQPPRNHLPPSNTPHATLSHLCHQVSSSQDALPPPGLSLLPWQTQIPPSGRNADTTPTVLSTALRSAHSILAVAVPTVVVCPRGRPHHTASRGCVLLIEALLVSCMEQATARRLCQLLVILLSSLLPQCLAVPPVPSMTAFVFFGLS